MIPEIKGDVKIPEGIEVFIEGSLIKVKGPKGELEKVFDYPGISIEKKENKILLNAKNATKREKRMIGTFKSHISNMIKGVNESYEYHLKVCSSHFPVSVAVDKDLVLIKNFLGEKVPRKSKIAKGVEVKVNGDQIVITGNDREKTGQTAANIEQACRIKKRDRRVFQDGIYITMKAGKKI
ncbi:MAG: 50S ribosomal protein L6 [Candidatus Nanoarchaeia archaeon]|nr:50S ribosomal protein L6 [Candidatus Nanoarchaeia archaeon]